MVAPDSVPFEILSSPTTMVSRFRIEDPATAGDRYLYVPGASFTAPGAAEDNVDGGDRYVYEGPAFVAWEAGQGGLQAGDTYVPLTDFVSRKPPAWQMVGRRLMAASSPPNRAVPDLPGFAAPVGSSQMLAPQQMYEHSAVTPNGDNKYVYDFNPNPHDGWGGGSPVFEAVPAGVLFDTLNQKASSETGRPATSADLTSQSTLSQLADATRGLLEPGKTVDQTMADNLASFFTGRGLPLKFFTTSASGDAGAGIGASVERGFVWNVQRGLVRRFMTAAVGIKIGAGGSVNPVNFGFWWGASEDGVLAAMAGLSLYTTLGATYGTGLNIILSWTTDYLAYGLTVSPQAGVEVEVGGEAGASYTWLTSPSPPDYGITMSTGAH